MRQVLRPPMTSALALTVSVKARAAPASRAISRNGRFETPAIGASTRLLSSLQDRSSIGRMGVTGSSMVTPGGEAASWIARRVPNF
jgi:hypothetical protein